MTLRYSNVASWKKMDQIDLYLLCTKLEVKNLPLLLVNISMFDSIFVIWAPEMVYMWG